MNQKQYYSLEELPLMMNMTDVAAVLGISRAGAYKLAHSADFPAFQIGKRMRRNSTYSDSNVIQKEPIPDGRPTALRRSGKSILSQSAALRSSRPAAPVCGHSAKYPWLRGSMPAKQLHSFSFPFGYEPRCRLSASSAWSAGARLRCRLHGIKCSNTLFRVSRRWSI